LVFSAVTTISSSDAADRSFSAAWPATGIKEREAVPARRAAAIFNDINPPGAVP
jgi:hypothetical protein